MFCSGIFGNYRNVAPGDVLKYCFSVILLSIVISSHFYTFFQNRISTHFYPDRDIEITVFFDDSEQEVSTIEMLDIASTKELWEQIYDCDKSDNWNYKRIDKDDVRWIASGKKGYAKMELYRCNYLHEYIALKTTNKKNSAIICINGSSKEYMLSEEVNIIELFDDSLEKRVVIVNSLVFLFALCVATIILFVFLYCINSGVISKGVMGREYGKWSIILLFIIFLVWGICAYYVGIEEYFSGYGDQHFYWNEENSLNPFLSAESIELPHRGYLSKWTGTLCIRLGELLGLRGELFWIVFLCVIHGALFGYVLPRIYELLNCGVKVRLYQMLAIVAVYLYGAFGYLPMGKLVDAAGFIFFFFSVWAFLESKKGSLLYSFLCGVFISVSISYRMTYKHALYCAILGEIIYTGYKVLKTRNLNILYEEIKASCLIALGLILIAIPQMYANFSKGIWGIFPYTYEGDSQAITTASWGLIYGTLVYDFPYGAKDVSFINMAVRDGLVFNNSTYSTMNVLSVLSSQWLDTVIYIFKKLFFGFSPIYSCDYTSIITEYPNSHPFIHSSKFAIIPLVNFVVLGITNYILFIKSNYITRKEKVLMWWIFLSLIVPQTFVHVEWRYYLPGYILVYYLTFLKTGKVRENMISEKGKIGWINEQARLLIFVSIYVVVSDSILWTFYNY